LASHAKVASPELAARAKAGHAAEVRAPNVT
jgi:hypothetical protein